MKSNQKDLPAGSVLSDFKEIFDRLKSRFLRQHTSDVGAADRLDRFDDDVAVIHGIAAPNLDVRLLPDADAAADAPAADAFAKPFREDHGARIPQAQGIRPKA